MKKLIVADAHMNPEGMSPMFRAALDMAYIKGWDFYSNGDTFQGLPHGIKKWMGSQCQADLIHYCYFRCFTITLIEGNHDWYEFLVKLFGDCPNIKIVKSAEIPYKDTKIIVRHGHNLGPLWSWLQYIAPPFVNFMSETFPGTWYKFSKKMGWIPSETVGEKRYHLIVRAVISGALRYCSKNMCRYTHGHTHKKSCVKEHFLYGMDYVVIGLDPLDTGCYLLIDDDIRYGSL